MFILKLLAQLFLQSSLDGADVLGVFLFLNPNAGGG